MPGGYVKSRTRLLTALAPFSETRVKARNELALITVRVTVLSGFV
jgi:hypothetical protein